MIPRLIHQIFIPDELGPRELDRATIANIDSWKQLHPNQEHRCWGLEEIRSLARSFDPRVLSAIDAAAFPAMKSDIARLVILLLHGGTYADLKLRCLKPFIEQFAAHRLVLFEHFRMAPAVRARHLTNGLIMAEAGHRFVDRALADCVRNVEARLDTGIWDTTGPRVLMRLQDEFVPAAYGEFVDGVGVVRESDTVGKLVVVAGGGYNWAGRHWHVRQARESIYTDRDIRPVERRGVAIGGDGPARSEEEQRAFFAAALDRALSAEARTGVVERCFLIADAVLCVRFAGASLARTFTPALSHLQIPPSTRADAVFHVWDSQSTDTKMIPPRFTQDCVNGRGDISTMASRRFRSAYLWGENALNLYDNDAATGVYWTSSAEMLPTWTKAAPLRCLLHWWAQSRGCQLMHGAAVGDARGAVLITGKGGVGKSTTALACLEQGLSYLGDDYVLLQLDPTPRVHSLYATAKVDGRRLAQFPRLAGLEGERDGVNGKAVLYLHPAMRDRLATSMPLRAIVTPRITGRAATEMETIPPHEMRRAALLTTLAQLSQAGPETHDFVARLVSRLPGWRLALGSDLATLPATIASLLAQSAVGGDRSLPEATIAAPSPPPLVSVIIWVGGDHAILAESIASVLAQEDADTEILLVEDEAAAGIDDIVSRLPVEVRRLPQHRGSPAAGRNRGVRECAGALVTFLRAGDRWLDGGLRMMIDCLRDDGGCDVVRGLDLSGSPAAALYRREAFERVGPFDEWLWSAEEDEWLDRARAHGLTTRRLTRATLVARPREEDAARRLVHEHRTLQLLKTMLDRDRGGGSPPG